MRSRLLYLNAMLLPLAAGVELSGTRADFVADVAVAPLAVKGDSGGILRAVADTCLERLVRELKAQAVAVVRVPQLSEHDLHLARPVPLAVLGQVERSNGQFQAELRLMDVASGEELRSYFNADRDPDALASLGTAAAKRIAQLVREQKGTR